VARPHLSEIILQALKPALSQESAENLNFNELILRDSNWPGSENEAYFGGWIKLRWQMELD